MPTPLISYPLDGTYQGRGMLSTLTASGTGAVRFGRGMSYIEEGTTNLVANPMGPSGTSGYISSPMCTLSAGHAVPNPPGVLGWPGVTTCFRSLINATSTPTGTNAVAGCSSTLPVAGTYSFSLWVYVPSTWTGGSLRVYPSSFTGSSGSITANIDMSKRDQWQYIVSGGTFVIGDLIGDFRIGPVLASGDWIIGEHIYFTAVQVEQKSYATPFVPRSIGASLAPGNAWTGTPHASTSTRTAGELVLPCDRQPAAIALRYSEDGLANRTLYTESLGQVIGSYGSVSWSGGALRITTGRLLWVDRVFAYDTPLNPKEQARIRSSVEIGRAGWDTLERNRSVYLTLMWWLYQ